MAAFLARPGAGGVHILWPRVAGFFALNLVVDLACGAAGSYLLTGGLLPTVVPAAFMMASLCTGACLGGAVASSRAKPSKPAKDGFGAEL